LVNWDFFQELPGASSRNFELLCRSLIRRHYGPYGEFVALANQPGVEFHLRLHTTCDLGIKDSWWGWQCRWFDLPAGSALGNSRREKIAAAIETSVHHVPGLTNWVLWTRRPLTRRDHSWFLGLSSRLKLHTWTAIEVEEHLAGPGDFLRAAYFGELVLTPTILERLHLESVAPLESRWNAKVHQSVTAERRIWRALGEELAWSHLAQLATRLSGSAETIAECQALPDDLKVRSEEFASHTKGLARQLSEVVTQLSTSDWDSLRPILSARQPVSRSWDRLLRELRARRLPVTMIATNTLADFHEAEKGLRSLLLEINWRIVAVVAEAGHGKTQLSAEMTASRPGRPAGLLLHGRDLRAGGNLDDLARKVVLSVTPISTFQALVAAVDAAGQRAGRRLPIFIDGLNEAEDPRNWKASLASLNVQLEMYPHVLVICTVRPAFVDDSIPEGIPHLAIPGFDEDTSAAIEKYFSHYKIERTDAHLPWDLLRHPLTLRMFCEVTNPTRERVVGVEAMPGSLTGLFDRFLQRVSERIHDLSSPICRHYDADVKSAIAALGAILWRSNSRSISTTAVRHELGDTGRPWDHSLVRALEHEHVLLRHADRALQISNDLAIVFDALGGHIVASSLIADFGVMGLDEWVRKPTTVSKLFGDPSERHPLAEDIVRALAGLIPRRLKRRQLWPLLSEPHREFALYEASKLEGEFIDESTVLELATRCHSSPVNLQRRGRDFFDRLRATRGAETHPLNSCFLDATLRTMPVWARDLRWSEWLRGQHVQIINDLAQLAKAWRDQRNSGHREQLRAKWVMWTLTSTVRPLRDQATYALYQYGCADPKGLFELTKESLAINDPYVPERMLAASYGVAMSLWSDPNGSELRTCLPRFAAELADLFFAEGTRNGTRHILTRDYALGIIQVAQLIDPSCIRAEGQERFAPPFPHLPVPFGYSDELEGETGFIVENDYLIDLYFEGHVIRDLIPDGPIFGAGSRDYLFIQNQVQKRISNLGFSVARFGDVDHVITEHMWRAEGRGEEAAEQYGKKYLWIAYYELYGFRSDRRELREDQQEYVDGERISEADIDPSFPQSPRAWMEPPLLDIFAGAPLAPRDWLSSGPKPQVQQFFHLSRLDGETGPWILLYGYLEQTAKFDGRRIFSFLSGYLTDPDDLKSLVADFHPSTITGSPAIPRPHSHDYLFFGEIPWSDRFRMDLGTSDDAQPRDLGQAFAYSDGNSWHTGIALEIPYRTFSWESHHSTLNQVSGTYVPSPSLCDFLGLTARQGEWDLFDRDGRRATLYREFKTDRDMYGSKWLYIRRDLLAHYLSHKDRSLVWLVWGERGFEARTSIALQNSDRYLYMGAENFHRSSFQWDPQGSTVVPLTPKPKSKTSLE
jgi:hypothetical protein